MPSKTAELQEYKLHQNSLEDQGYLRFLNRLVTALIPHIASTSTILDFGSGPCPALAHLFNQQGFAVDCFDPLFGPTIIPSSQYDVITCSEAIEHFHRPQIQWQQWMELLAPKGWLAIMTKRVIDVERFANWHYKNDITHVSFFSEATFNWLAQQYKMKVIFAQDDIVLMQKQNR